jgi:ABC-type hemin transport system ATPase subunit
VGVVHDLNFAARFADHVVLLNEARVVAQRRRGRSLHLQLISETYPGTPATR